MRILIVCPYPMQPELGAVQVHLNLAEGLRALGHDVTVWSPYPLRETHLMAVVLKTRARLDELLRSGEKFDVIDCAPVHSRGRFTRYDATWVARSVQPDILYLMEDLRGRAGSFPRNLLRTGALATWSALVTALVYRGWSVSDVVMCFGSMERTWIGDRFPWLRPKLRSYDGALADDERVDLVRVRRARRPPIPSERVRYLWIGRWTEHKGTGQLVAFLRERVARRYNEQFTIAGCGHQGERALAQLIGSGAVRVVPSFTRAELPNLLAVHDAGLFTSRVEGWGLVLNEMVESGLPVYATSAGGVHDIRSVLGSFIADFPPPPGAQLPSPPADEAIARYDARFRWLAIAARYVESITLPR
jgi:glycosyltransferase involved in cell wall biosynthesis